MIVPKEYGHLDLGYVITSHASQGKDRQLAIAAMGSQSLPAINSKQFYVTASRGSEDLTLYVDDKQKIRQAVERDGQQLSATELLASAPSVQQQTLDRQQQQRTLRQRISTSVQKTW